MAEYNENEILEEDDDFDPDFDPEFDAFVELMRQIKEEDEKAGTIRICDPARMTELSDCYHLLKRIAVETNPGAEIEYGIKDLSGAGYISVSFKDLLEITETEALKEVIGRCSNFEIVEAKNKIWINLIFYGCTVTYRLSKN